MNYEYYIDMYLKLNAFIHYNLRTSKNLNKNIFKNF